MDAGTGWISAIFRDECHNTGRRRGGNGGEFKLSNAFEIELRRDSLKIGTEKLKFVRYESSADRFLRIPLNHKRFVNLLMKRSN